MTNPIKLLLLLFGCGLVAGCDPAREARERNECVANLKAIWYSLYDYREEYHDLPRDERGQFSLRTLLNSQLPTNRIKRPEQMGCRFGTSAKSVPYQVNPNLTVEDFGKSNVIVATDAPESHDAVLLILLGDGSVPYVNATTEEKWQWCRAFVAGEPVATEQIMGRLKEQDENSYRWRSN